MKFKWDKQQNYPDFSVVILNRHNFCYFTNPNKFTTCEFVRISEMNNPVPLRKFLRKIF